MITLLIDADACPVKQEIYRVAERHALKGTALKVLVVSNSPIAVPRDPLIERVVVGAGMDEADNWIAARAHRGDIVITADVPLASRCVKAGAAVLAPHAFDICTPIDMCTPMGYNLQCLGARSRLLNSPAIVGAPMIS
jgi:uncharacterized protein YaiI (UPF0178 family)